MEKIKLSYVTVSQIMQMLGVSRPTLYKYMKTDPDFPKPKKLSLRKQVFDLEEIKEWINNKNN